MSSPAGAYGASYYNNGWENTRWLANGIVTGYNYNAVGGLTPSQVEARVRLRALVTTGSLTSKASPPTTEAVPRFPMAQEPLDMTVKTA